MVVEDEALIGMLFAEVLGQMGHEVCAIEDTEAGAIAAAAQYRPDLMIVDARLSNGSGISAVDQILRNGFIPHVFVSGDVSSIRAQRPGAVVLQKPFRDPDIVRAIERALNAKAPT